MNYNDALEKIFDQFIKGLEFIPEFTFSHEDIIDDFKENNIVFDFDKIQAFFKNKGITFCDCNDNPFSKLLCSEPNIQKYTISKF